MAWVSKQSGTTQIETRDEPWLTPEMRKQLTETILPRYEKAMGALLPALHMIQHEYGWVPHQAMMEIAEALDIAPADVLDTASFYEEYWLKQKGRHVVAVCRSIACEFCKSREVTQACMDKLGIEVGETTPDNKFTLVELECLGSCGTAPVALIDETLHENLTPAEMTKLLDETKD